MQSRETKRKRLVYDWWNLLSAVANVSRQRRRRLIVDTSRRRTLLSRAVRPHSMPQRNMRLLGQRQRTVRLPARQLWHQISDGGGQGANPSHARSNCEVNYDMWGWLNCGFYYWSDPNVVSCGDNCPDLSYTYEPPLTTADRGEAVADLQSTAGNSSARALNVYPRYRPAESGSAAARSRKYRNLELAPSHSGT